MKLTLSEVHDRMTAARDIMAAEPKGANDGLVDVEQITVVGDEPTDDTAQVAEIQALYHDVCVALERLDQKFHDYFACR